MKAKWIVSAIVASALTAPAFAQVGTYIGRTPPPLRYEAEGPMPGPGYVWTEGSWAWDGGRYEWRRGSWQRPPMKEPTGAILTTTTTRRAGQSMKATGTMKTTGTTTTGITMITAIITTATTGSRSRANDRGLTYRQAPVDGKKFDGNSSTRYTYPLDARAK